MKSAAHTLFPCLKRGPRFSSSSLAKYFLVGSLALFRTLPLKKSYSRIVLHTLTCSLVCSARGSAASNKNSLKHVCLLYACIYSLFHLACPG